MKRMPITFECAEEYEPLAPMEFDEALALVIMLGGAGAMSIIPFPRSPALAKSPLHQLVASLPAHQYSVFQATMNGAWPKPQRNTLKRPVDVNGNRTSIATWNDAWAMALSAASKSQTQMADAYYEALYGPK